MRLARGSLRELEDFHLISAKGAMGANLGEMDEDQRQVLRSFTQQVAEGLESVSAYQAPNRAHTRGINNIYIYYRYYI